MLSGKRLTVAVVVATMGVGLSVATYYMLGPKWWAVATVYLLYEAYCLANKWGGDTISEGIWDLNERPIVPWLFGVAVGWGLGKGYIHGPELSLAIGFLSGHFFFQRQTKKVEHRHE